MAEASLNQKAECGVCMEQVLSLKILPCSHKFCFQCLTKLSEENNTVNCPNCREKHRMLPKTLTHLPTFYSGFMECGICRQREKIAKCYWCSSCVQIMCPNCHIDEHLWRGHEVFKWQTHQAINDLWSYSFKEIQKLHNQKEHMEEKQVIKNFCMELEIELLTKLDQMKKENQPDVMGISLHDHLRELFGCLNIGGVGEI